MQFVLIKSPHGPSLCCGVKCPDAMDAMQIVSTVIRWDCDVFRYSFEQMLKFTAHYSATYEIGSLKFEVAAKFPFHQSDYFNKWFVSHFVRAEQY